MQLYNRDCLDVMARLPEGSVDLIATDPPYGVTACPWDAVVPLEAMWEAFKRVAKPYAPIIITGTQPFVTSVIHSNREMFKYDWIWCKSRVTDFVRAQLKPMGGHEHVLVFSTGSVANGAKNNMPYYPQGLTRVNKTVSNGKGPGGAGFLGRNKSNLGANNKLHDPTYVQEFEGYPNTKLSFGPDKDGFHPTQKPVALMAYLINTYSLPGQVVMDPFMGSGTTGVAAKDTGREFIGIELNTEYYVKAKERIKNHTPGFFPIEPQPRSKR